MERISFKRIHREKYASLRDPINGYSGENSRFIRPSRFVSQLAPRFHRSVSRRRVIGYYCAGTCDERSPIPKGYYSTAIRCVVISVFIRLRRINASQQLSFSSVNSVERNFERYASLREFILLVVPVSFPASSSVCFFFFSCLSLRSLARTSSRFFHRFILYLSFHLRFSPLLCFSFLRVPFFAALAHYRELDVTRERGILMYTVELRCSRREKKRKGWEGEKVNCKVFLIGGVSSVAFCREERHVFSREDIVWRLTHFYFDLSSRAPPLFGHPLQTFRPFFSFLFARKSREYHPLFFLYVFSFLLLPSLSLSFLLPKNIKIKLEGEKIGNFQRLYRFFTIKILNRSKIFDMFRVP